MGDQLAKIIASTLTEQDPEHGLSDVQVAAFLAAFEQKVPLDIKGDPTRLISLLECSKDIARHIAEYDMPHFSVTVQDFRFSPPNIEAELPCHLHFKLLPYSADQQISVINNSTNEVVACSGPLKPGDSFSTTVVEPGSYAFTSELYPFMSGQLIATGDADGSSNSRLEAQPSADCIKASSSQEPALKHTAPGPTAQPAPAAAGKAQPEKASSCGSRRLSALDTASKSPVPPPSTAAQHDALQQQEPQPVGAAGESDTLQPPAAAAASSPAPAASHSATFLTERCRRSSYGSDGWDPLAQQPSEQAVLELVAAGAQPQHTQPPQPAAGQANVTAEDAAARYIPAGQLSRSGRWARRATAYGDEADVGIHQVSSTTAAAEESQPQGQQRGGPCAAVRFAKGLEGLVFSPSCTPQGEAHTAADWRDGAGARASGPGSSVFPGSCGTGSQDSDTGEAADAGELSDSCAGDPAAEDWYERLPSHSSEHSSGSEEPEPVESPGAVLSHDQLAQALRIVQHGLSDAQAGDVTSEEARLLSAGSSPRNGSRRHCRRPKLAWQQGSDSAAGDGSGSGSESDSGAHGDVRLRFLAKRTAGIRSHQASPQQLSPSTRGAGPPVSPMIDSYSSSAVRAGSNRARVEAGAQTSPLSADSMHLRFKNAPGSSWALGGQSLKAFSSTTASAADGPGQGGGSSSSTGTFNISSGHASTAAAAAAAVTAAVKKGLGSGSINTLLGPGMHRIGQLPSIKSSSGGGGSTTSSTAAALLSREASKAAGQQQTQQLQLKLPGMVNMGDGAGRQPHQQQGSPDDSDDGSSSPPALHARLAQKHQQGAAATARSSKVTALSRNSSSSGSSTTAGATSISATAAAAAAAGVAAASAGTTKAHVTNKKKKGRSKLSEADVAAERAAAEARACAEARRRDRDCVEFALLDRGSSSRGDSEDEPHIRALAAAGISPGLNSKGQPALDKLSKCKFKGCKLTFASSLNQQRCHMSHLPSARTATAKAYKAYKDEVVAFLKSLPAAAVAKLLRLPEPAWLPKRPLAPRSNQQKQQQPTGTAKPSADTAGTAKDATEEPIAKLQSSPLCTSWIVDTAMATQRSGDVRGAMAVLSTFQPSTTMSQLAKLCCGVTQVAAGSGKADAAADADAADDECLPLLAPPARQQQQQQGGAEHSSPGHSRHESGTAGEPLTAEAAAAAEFATACSACCSQLGSAAAAGGTSAGCACGCRCHSAVERLIPVLPPTDVIIELLDQASEGTWLCNPRLLQQPHNNSCSCSVCTLPRAATAPDHSVAGVGASVGQQGWSPEAVMASISSGYDVLDVLAEHGVNDAALSYAVERRLLTAYHKAKEAEARHIMSQLLDEGSSSSKAASAAAGSSGKPGAGAAAGGAASVSQSGSTAAVAAAGAGAKKGKDKKKASKGGKASAVVSKKVPAWKAVSSDSEDGGSSSSRGEEEEELVPLAIHIKHPHRSTTAAAAAAAATNSKRESAGAAAAGAQAAQDTCLQGRLAAEQLLQARLAQQNEELQQLQALKQQQHRPVGSGADAKHSSGHQQHQQQHTNTAQQRKQVLQRPQQQLQQQRAYQRPEQLKQQQVRPAAATSSVAKQQQQHSKAVLEATSRQPDIGSSAAAAPQAGSKPQAVPIAASAGAASSKPQRDQQQQPEPKHQLQGQQQEDQSNAAARKELSQPNGALHTQQQRQQRRPQPSQQQIPESLCPPQQQQQRVAAVVQQQPAAAAAGVSAPEPCAPSVSAAPATAAAADQPAVQARATTVPSYTAAGATAAAVTSTPPAAAPCPACRGGSGSGSNSQQPAAMLLEPVPVPRSDSAAAAGIEPEYAADGSYLCDEEGYGEEEEEYAEDGEYGEGQEYADEEYWQEQQDGTEQQQQDTGQAWSGQEQQYWQEQQHWQQQHQAAHYQQQPHEQEHGQLQHALYYQQLQQQQSAMLQPLVNQPGMLMHQYWLTGAHSRAAQDMLVCTGRAAAAAEGQEVLPFNAAELQQIAIWTSYYYQHLLMSMAAMQAQQQQQQDPTAPQDPAAAAAATAGGARAAGSADVPTSSAAAVVGTAEQQPSSVTANDGSCIGADSRPTSSSSSAGRDSTPQPQSQAAVLDGQQQQQGAAVHFGAMLRDGQQRWVAQQDQAAPQQQQEVFELQFGTLPADLLLLDAAEDSIQAQQPPQVDTAHHAAASAAATHASSPVAAGAGLATEQQEAQQEQGQPSQPAGCSTSSSRFVQDMQQAMAASTAVDMNSQHYQQDPQQRQQQHATWRRRPQQQQSGSFKAAEAAAMLDERWQAVVESCGPPKPSAVRKQRSSSSRAVQATSRGTSSSRSSSGSRSRQHHTESRGSEARASQHVNHSTAQADGRQQQQYGSHKTPHQQPGAAAGSGGGGSNEEPAAAGGPVGQRRGAWGRPHRQQQHGGSDGHKGHGGVQSVWRVRH